MTRLTRRVYEDQASNLARAAAVFMDEGDYGKAEQCLKDALAALQKAREASS